MRRLAPVLAGMAGVGLLLPLLVGSGPRGVVLLVPFTGLLGLAAVAVTRRAAAPDPGWTGPGPATESRLGPPGPTPRSRSAPAAGKVALALARVEGRELAGSPWFGVGVGFLVVSFLLFTVVYGSGNGEHWADVVGLAPWLAHPLVGMVVVAAHRGVTRAPRDGADELFDTCPVAPATRTLAAIGSAWVPVVALLVFFLAYGAVVSLRSPNLYGSPGALAVPVLLGGLVLAVGGVTLGVALARWVPFALAPVAAVVAVGFLSLRLATAGDPGWNPLQQLSSAPPLPEGSPVFHDPPAWSHVAWLFTLTATVAVLAVARHRRDRRVAVLGAAVLLLLPVTAIAATRQMPAASARRIAGLIARPAEHQTCQPAGPLPVCVYAGLEELGRRAAAEVAPVAEALPPEARPVVLRQRFPGTAADLPPEVARLLPEGVPRVPDGEAALGFSASRRALVDTRSLLALSALDLPVEATPEGPPLVVAGQARGVLALWLSTRGLGPVDTRRLTTSRTPDEHDCRDPSVALSSLDLRAARALIALPEPAVRAVVHEGWERWRDPAAGADELLAAAGLPPAGPYPAWADGSENPC